MKNNSMDGLDLELEKLLDRTGKFYMAYGWPYNKYEKHSAQQLQEEKITLFIAWLKNHYEKRK